MWSAADMQHTWFGLVFCVRVTAFGIKSGFTAFRVLFARQMPCTWKESGLTNVGKVFYKAVACVLAVPNRCNASRQPRLGEKK